MSASTTGLPPPTDPVRAEHRLHTSAPLRHIANALNRGEHVAVSGAGGWVLLRDELMLTTAAILHMARSAFPIVVRADATGAQVVGGIDAYCALPDRPFTAQERPGRDLYGDPALNGQVLHVGDGEAVPDIVRWMLTQGQRSACVVIDGVEFAFPIEPSHHDLAERARVAVTHAGLRDAAWNGTYRNTAFLLAGSRAGLPAMLLAGLNDVAYVDVDLSDAADRRVWFGANLHDFHGGDQVAGDPVAAADVVDDLVAHTDGETLGAVVSLPVYSRARRIEVQRGSQLVAAWRHGQQTDHWDIVGGRLGRIRTSLETQVFGQPEAIDAVVDAIAGATLGLDLTGNPTGREGKPRAVLVFAGMPGCGKTQLAKATAGALYGNPEAYVRIDCAVLAQQHDAARLFGAPPGYVGYEEGGQLTEAVRRNPASVVLFDEFNRAHEDLLERIMSILADGHVTDSHGRTVHFGESVVIFTTNLGSKEVDELMAATGGEAGYGDVRAELVQAVRHYLAKQPALLSRLKDAIVGFDVVRPEVLDQITAKIVGAAGFRRGPALDMDVRSTQQAVRTFSHRVSSGALDARQAEAVVGAALKRIASHLVTTGRSGARHVAVRFRPDGDLALSVDNGPEEEVG